MLTEPLSFLIAAMLVVVFAIHTLADVLNLGALAPSVPAEFESLYDADAYARSQEYTRARTRFGWIVGVDVFAHSNLITKRHAYGDVVVPPPGY